jgi:hypothetical protein
MASTAGSRWRTRTSDVTAGWGAPGTNTSTFPRAESTGMLAVVSTQAPTNTGTALVRGLGNPPALAVKSVPARNVASPTVSVKTNKAEQWQLLEKCHYRPRLRAESPDYCSRCRRAHVIVDRTTGRPSSRSSATCRCGSRVSRRDVGDVGGPAFAGSGRAAPRSTKACRATATNDARERFRRCMRCSTASRVYPVAPGKV